MCCSPVGVRRLFVCVLFNVCCLMFVIRCLLLGVCCSLFTVSACCALFLCCLLLAGCGVCCLLVVGRRLFSVVWRFCCFLVAV